MAALGCISVGRFVLQLEWKMMMRVEMIEAERLSEWWWWRRIRWRAEGGERGDDFNGDHWKQVMAMLTLREHHTAEGAQGAEGMNERELSGVHWASKELLAIYLMDWYTTEEENTIQILSSHSNDEILPKIPLSSLSSSRSSRKREREREWESEREGRENVNNRWEKSSHHLKGARETSHFKWAQSGAAAIHLASIASLFGKHFHHLKKHIWVREREREGAKWEMQPESAFRDVW